MFICTYVCTFVRMYVHLYVCMYICTYVCTFVRMYVHLYVCMYIGMATIFNVANCAKALTRSYDALLCEPDERLARLDIDLQS
jgi:hypothetical protein